MGGIGEDKGLVDLLHPLIVETLADFPFQVIVTVVDLPYFRFCKQ